MTLHDARYRLHQLLRRHQLTRVTELLLLSAGLALVITTLLGVAGAGSWRYAAGIILGAGNLALVIRRARILSLTTLDIASWLNHQHPALEQSCDLLVLDKSLTALQELQREMTLTAFGQVAPAIRLPHRLGRSAVVLAAGIAALWLIPAVMPDVPVEASMAPNASNKPAGPATLTQLELKAMPPAYTGLAPIIGTNTVRTVEGSQLQWRAQFSKPVDAWIILSGRDTLRMKFASDYNAKKTVQASAFYQVMWRDGDQYFHSDYYPIHLYRDEPPVITTSGESYVSFEPGDVLQTSAHADVLDDFGLTDATIIATVSKGSGESVKFREVHLPFPTRISGKSARLSRTLDLKALGLDPGDELYYYIAATDNRVPVHQLARTETFFVSVADTTQQESVADAGLGVDLMPEYFRSQRQIIIDSEKLLAEQKKLERTTFRDCSNLLAHDQKTLRLRYGQFMGEEADEGIGMEAGGHHEEEEQDPIKQFGHQHDKDNEHNLVPERKAEEQKKNPLEAFAHQHDNTEEATFFVQSVKAKLRAALTLMWDAELHLRMADPRTSLPYQYKILKLLKEISQDSRVYVHRTGFDPPPIKEEKRLAGDLADVRSGKRQSDRRLTVTNPALVAAVEALQRHLAQPNAHDLNLKSALQQAGAEVAAIVLQDPAHVGVLGQLRKLADASDINTRTGELNKLLLNLYLLLPATTPAPQRGYRAAHPLQADWTEYLDVEPVTPQRK